MTEPIKLPPPHGYIYVWDGPYGTHRLVAGQYNGRQCDRTVAYCTEAQVHAAIEADRQARGEPVYAFRRKGLTDFSTCTKERFDELSDNPLFDTRIFYTAPQPAEPVKTRKAFICAACDGVYADSPVSQCDCMPEKDEFIEGTLSYPSAEPVGVQIEEIIESVKAYGRAYSMPNTTATELTIRLHDIRTLLAKYTAPQPKQQASELTSSTLGPIKVGNLPTVNQDDYPGLGDWWVQLRVGSDNDEVLARVYGDTPQQAYERAILLVKPQPQQQIPEGYKLVPVEPTIEMCDAALAVQGSCTKGVYHVYRAMLEAAPEPKEPT